MSPALPTPSFEGRCLYGKLRLPSPDKNTTVTESYVNHISEVTQPLSHCFGFSVDNENSAASSIICLLGFCRPFAVLRFIVSVIVAAFYRMLHRRRQSHIRKEIGKCCIPRRANRNPASTVFIPRGVRLAFATASHSHVGAISLFEKLIGRMLDAVFLTFFLDHNKYYDLHAYYGQRLFGHG